MIMRTWAERFILPGGMNQYNPLHEGGRKEEGSHVHMDCDYDSKKTNWTNIMHTDEGKKKKENCIEGGKTKTRERRSNSGPVVTRARSTAFFHMIIGCS